MFDGNADSSVGADANVARLCALYDGLLERPDATVSAEAETELADRVNGQASQVMAEEASALGAWLIHYSTDYVFDGKGLAPWLE
ncbi:MAG: sugar nucleotide-binding protein, partial [Brevundimonas sp.]